jgi:hypothetical protein
MQQRKAIAKDEGVMLGKPTVSGTPLTVELILKKLAAGKASAKSWGLTRALTESPFASLAVRCRAGPGGAG